MGDREDREVSEEEEDLSDESEIVDLLCPCTYSMSTTPDGNLPCVALYVTTLL
jgi:hypothetical protein